MPGGNALPIHSYEGANWEAALELLESGEGTISIGPAHIKRWVGWPGADGAIHVAIYTTWLRENLTEGIAETEVQTGRIAVSTAEKADPRLTALFERFGVVWEYCRDYGNGSTLLASVEPNGNMQWKQRP